MLETVALASGHVKKEGWGQWVVPWLFQAAEWHEEGDFPHFGLSRMVVASVRVLAGIFSHLP